MEHAEIRELLPEDLVRMACAWVQGPELRFSIVSPHSTSKLQGGRVDGGVPDPAAFQS
jgi:hypothetical protein